MSLRTRLRTILWHILGVDYQHMMRVIDYVYLKEDKYTVIGHKTYSNNAMVFRWSDASIEVGKYCSIADGVRFIVDNDKHLIDGVTSYPFKFNATGDKKGITIGNDVWIGQNVVILPGVKIGNGVTIGAGAVVTKDIPDYSLAGGSPAKVIRQKCTDKEISAMNRIAWWNWSDKKVTEHYADFSLSIPDFIKKHTS